VHPAEIFYPRGARFSFHTTKTRSRHAQLKIVAAQISHFTPYRWSQFPVLMA
jgi:hypothetical protein